MHEEQYPISEQIAFIYERLVAMCLEEVQILHEQVEFLQELVESENFTESFQQKKIQELEQELSMTNHDLSAALMLNQLSFDEAKKVAQIILNGENSAEESCAKLLSAIYGTTVPAEELQQLDKFDVATDSFHKITKKSQIFLLNSHRLKNYLQQIHQEYNKLEDKFLKFKSHYEKFESTRTDLKTQKD